MRTSARRAVAGLGLVVLMAGCGGSESGGPAQSTSSTAGTTSTASTTSTAGTSMASASTTASTPSGTTTSTPKPLTTTATSASDTTSSATTDPVCSPVSITDGSTALRAERCGPADGAAGPAPAALVLHGCGGYDADAAVTEALARALAVRGVVTLRLDYLSFGPAPPTGYCYPQAVAAAAPDIVRAVAAGIAALRSDGAVDPARVAGVGYSLGALGVALAQLGGGGFADVPPAGLAALGFVSPVVHGELAGVARTGKLPPSIVVVGGADAVVGTRGSTSLADAAAAAGVDVELHVVPGQGHAWRGAALEATADRVATFVAARLAAVQPGVRT
jgi:carboxymethylenebutenolidase